MIESGQISAFLDQNKGQGIRIRTIVPGGIIGEKDNSATSIIVNKPGKIHHLSEKNLNLMEEHHPDMAFKLYKYMTQILGDRLDRTNNVIQDLLK